MIHSFLRLWDTLCSSIKTTILQERSRKYQKQQQKNSFGRSGERSVEAAKTNDPQQDGLKNSKSGPPRRNFHRSLQRDKPRWTKASSPKGVTASPESRHGRRLPGTDKVKAPRSEGRSERSKLRAPRIWNSSKSSGDGTLGRYGWGRIRQEIAACAFDAWNRIDMV